MSPIANLDVAIKQHLSGVRDNEERSPLHLLVSELVINTGLRKRMSKQLTALLSKSTARSDDWWRCVEWVIVDGRLTDELLIRALENIAVCNRRSTPTARVHVLQALAEVGKALPAVDLINDTELRDALYARWMDLVWGGLADWQAKRALILSGVRGGKLSVADLEYRLDRIREAGGRRLSEFAADIVRGIPEGQRREVAALFENAFGVTQPYRQLPMALAAKSQLDFPKPSNLAALVATYKKTRDAAIIPVHGPA